MYENISVRQIRTFFRVALTSSNLMVNRYLVRLSNKKRASVSQIESVKASIAKHLVHEDLKIGNFRISNQAIEFDLFTQENMERVREQLDQNQALLSLRKITERPAEDLTSAIEQTRNLFREERFWECHEVLEGVWLRSSGGQKKNLQTLILVCAALVHLQRNQLEICLSMLRRYRNRLELEDRHQLGIDFKLLGREVDQILKMRNLVPFSL